MRKGFPKVLGVAGLVLLPCFLSGAIRTVTGVSMAASLGLAVAGAAGLAWWQRRALAQPWQDRDGALATGLVAALFAILLVGLLYNRFFNGVPMWSGIPDAANHALERRRFLDATPRTYGQFVAGYAFATCLQWILRCNDFWMFTIAFYLLLILYSATAAGVTACALAEHGAHRRARRCGWLVSSGVGVALLLAAALPLFHYHHGEGFYAHLFALIPLLGIWVVDGLIERPIARMVTTVALAVLYRYTYGLSLPDLCIALAIIAIAETPRARSWWLRGALVAGGAVLLLVARQAVLAIATVYHREGPFTPFDLRPAILAQLVLVVFLAAPVVIPPIRALAGTEVVRWVRLPLLLGLISTLFLAFAPVPPRKQDYYFYKTHLLAVLLMVPAVSMLAGRLAAAAIAAARPQPHRWVWAGVALTTLGAVGGFFQAFAPWRDTLTERIVGRPPFPRLRPLADLWAWHQIETVLARTNKQFGGYLTSFYPLMNFMNSSFGFNNGGIAFYWGAAPRDQPGYCVFWEWCEPPAQCIEPGWPQEWRLKIMQADRTDCVSYHPSWNPAGTRSLCWKCR